MNWKSVARLVVLVLILLFLSLFIDEAPAQTKAQKATGTIDEERLSISDVGDVSAYSFAVYDLNNDLEIISRNGDEVLPIASITKLFTASVVLDDMNLPAEKVITEFDVSTHGGAGLLEVGQKYSVRDLLFPLLLSSSNDAATALNEISQAQLIPKMNRLVVDHGASNTSFVDASGLGDDNVSTAREIARLTARLFESQPGLFAFSRQERVLGPYVGWENNSPVIDFDGYLGGKHGYTEAAGRTIVSIFDEEINGRSHKIAYVLLNSADLAGDIYLLRSKLRSKDS